MFLFHSGKECRSASGIAQMLGARDASVPRMTSL
jgi:hypothetical protein